MNFIEELDFEKRENRFSYFNTKTDISTLNCLFIMIDIQEKLVNVMNNKDTLIKNVEILNKSSDILNIPLLFTEQSPEKLGSTIVEIGVESSLKRKFIKTRFSVFTDEISDYIDTLTKPILVIYGIETHVCVFQSCIDAIKNGFHVIVVVDAVSSRKEYSKEIALEMLINKGVEVATIEMLLFRLLKDASHPSFRDISKLIK